MQEIEAGAPSTPQPSMTHLELQSVSPPFQAQRARNPSSSSTPVLWIDQRVSDTSVPPLCSLPKCFILKSPWWEGLISPHPHPYHDAGHTERLPDFLALLFYTSDEIYPRITDLNLKELWRPFGPLVFKLCLFSTVEIFVQIKFEHQTK